MHGYHGTLVLDHERFKQLLGEYLAARGREEARAAECWREFDRALRAHAGAEERVLYPAYESNVRPSAPGPLLELRQQHIEMLALLDAIEASAPGDTGRRGREEALMTLLWTHERRETAIFLPWMQACLTETQRTELNERMARMRDRLDAGAPV